MIQGFYTAEEIATILHITTRGSRKKAKDGKWSFRRRVGKEREYSFTEFPCDVQEKIKEFEENKLKIESQPKQETILQHVYKLSQPTLNRAEGREMILRAFKAFTQQSSLSKTQNIKTFCLRYNNKDILNDTLIHHLMPTLSERSLYTWEKEYAQNGLSGLADNYGSRKGQTIIDMNTQIKEFILGMIAAHPHANCKHIIRGLRERFDRNALPSYRTLQNWLSAWKRDNKSTLMAMTNPDKWRNYFQAATGSYSENILRLNQLWEFDSTPTDILLNDGKRHTIIGVIDVYSRRVKLLVSHTSNSKAVAAILRKCLIDWGVPEVVKMDNGADYVSKHITRVLEHLEIERKLCPPFTPNAKPHVERVFKTFSHDLMELLPGFIGHNVAERKDIEARKSFADHIMGKAKEPFNLNLSAEKLQEFCDKWTDNLYMQSEHGGLNNRTPFEVFTNYTGSIRKIQNERALDILLSETSGDGLRYVTKKGIAIENNHYDSADLAGFEGQQVKVLYDEASFGEIYVFTLADEFICKAICPERLGISRAEVAVHRRQKQKRLINEQKTALNKLAKEYGTHNIAQEILESKYKETSKIIPMPKKAQEYSSKFLAEAESILSAPNRKPRELSEQEKIVLEQLRNTGKIEVIVRETSEQKYNRWLDIADKYTHGKSLTNEEETFYKTYQKSTEFKTTAFMREKQMRCG